MGTPRGQNWLGLVKILAFFIIFCKNRYKTPSYMVYPLMIMVQNNAKSVKLMIL